MGPVSPNHVIVDFYGKNWHASGIASPFPTTLVGCSTVRKMKVGDVLVVSDDSAFGQTVLELVESLGWNFVCVPEVEHALSYVSVAVPVAIVVHRVGSGTRDAMQAAEQLRISRWTPIVIAAVPSPSSEAISRAFDLDIEMLDDTKSDWAVELNRLLYRRQTRPSSIVMKTGPTLEARRKNSG